ARAGGRAYGRNGEATWNGGYHRHGKVDRVGSEIGDVTRINRDVGGGVAHDGRVKQLEGIKAAGSAAGHGVGRRHVQAVDGAVAGDVPQVGVDVNAVGPGSVGGSKRGAVHGDRTADVENFFGLVEAGGAVGHGRHDVAQDNGPGLGHGVGVMEADMRGVERRHR